jgi:hypothetical protein
MKENMILSRISYFMLSLMGYSSAEHLLCLFGFTATMPLVFFIGAIITILIILLIEKS